MTLRYHTSTYENPVFFVSVLKEIKKRMKSADASLIAISAMKEKKRKGAEQRDEIVFLVNK